LKLSRATVVQRCITHMRTHDIRNTMLSQDEVSCTRRSCVAGRIPQIPLFSRVI
jgi:hypothetical protein